MTPSALREQLVEEYGLALRAYVSGAEESALAHAYEIGRGAIERGLGLLDLTSVHGDALASLLRDATTPEEGARRARAAVEFLAESLAAFEMAQQGYQAATTRLLEAKKELEESAARLADTNAALQEEIAERKQAEEAARGAQDEAEQANRAKSEFLSRMSHELRTPLNSILGFAQLMEMEDLDEDHRASVGQIRTAGHHLLSLIDEVLEISRIETGRIRLSVEPVFVAEAIHEAVAMVGPIAAARNVDVRVEMGDVDGMCVSGDRQRLKQVLLNLLSNGVKYNREGGTLAVSCRRTAGGDVSILVQDTGVGIPAEVVDRLFVPFDRLGAEASGVEGIGLGLAVSKGLIEAMGGSITLLTSTLGVGSLFAIELAAVEKPIDRYERLTEVSEESETTPTTGVVVYIEDNLANLELIQRVFARRPHLELIPAMQGRLGLDLIREHRPNLVLLDLHLPDVPGLEVLRSLQDDPSTRDIPVVVLSADALIDHRRELLAAGARVYLTKPIDVKELLRTIDDVIDGALDQR